MNRILFIYCSVMLYAITAKSQKLLKYNTYLDAIELAKIERSVPLYGNSSELRDVFNNILLKYDDKFGNPFLALKEPPKVYGTGTRTDNYPSPPPPPKYIYPGQQAFLQNFQATSFQATAINGIANFMAGRFKQEALHMGIDLVFKHIKNDTNKIIKTLFTNTYDQITLLYNDKNGYYTSDLLYLRQILLTDIEQIPHTIISASDVLLPTLSNKPELKDMLTVSHNVYESSRQNEALPFIISSLDEQKYESMQMTRIINLIDLFSQALLDTVGGKSLWVDPSLLFPYTAADINKLEIRYFYGLLYEQLKKDVTIRNYLSKYEYDIKILACKMQELFVFVNKLNGTYNAIRSYDFTLKSTEDIMAYVNNVHQCIYTFINTGMLKNIFYLHDETIPIANHYLKITETLLQKDYQRAIPLIFIQLGQYMNESYTKELAFMSQLASVETANDMENLLLAYSLPIGSSSIKRKCKTNLTLNGYVGLTAGQETAYGSLQNQTRTNIGLTTPIGLTYTFGARKNTYSLFASFIDLGSMVNTRLNNDTTSYNNLKFEHFLTPGIGLYYNARKYPITLGAHFSYISNLRTIKYVNQNATITDTHTSVSRLNLSILFDIPFVTLFHNPE